ncbi:MAG TPA: DUF2934 domain-containing protein [Steroidobacteraceae bacterium]|nr:DUF2934 domain-containing protein [Steroidobacteraceae bacterium]
MGKALTRRSGPRTLVRSRTKAAVAGAVEPDSIVTRPAVEPETRAAMIAEAAYFRAEKRGFDPGHELGDWLAAEADIERALVHVDAPTPCGDEIGTVGAIE